MAAKKKQKPEPVEFVHKMGYARVSTSEQDLRLQRDALIAAGVDPRDIWEEKKSGASLENRKEFQDMMRDCRAGDTIYVWKLDRLARNAMDLYQTVQLIEEKGARLVVLTMPGMDTGTAVGKMLFGIFAVFAEFERALTVERTMAGLKSARAAGKTGGRAPLHTDEVILAARGMRPTDAAKKLKMTVGGYTKALERALKRLAEKATDDEQV